LLATLGHRFSGTSGSLAGRLLLSASGH
jgi:hypothetical protein